MNTRIIVLIGLIAIHVSSCNIVNKEQIHISQLKIKHLPKLSSASGICLHNDSIYLVGDDTPWLYELDSTFNIVDKTKISAIDTLVEGRTPKYLKADFESMEIISDSSKFELVIISSGSIPITRDTAFIVSLSDSRQTYSKSLRPLYDKIKLKANLPKTSEINIEGTVFSDDDAYLLHRGNISENIIININREDFIAFIMHHGPIPKFDIYKFNLPEYKGVSSGFSGACLNPDKSGLIFTASMEDTKDEINDGKVLGSFIGIIPFSKISEGKFTAALVKANNQVLEKKIEGVSAKFIDEKREIVSKNEKMQIITVCDNDNGTSDIITFNISIK